MEKDDSSQSNEGQKKFIHLIVFEKGVKSFYYDHCEVRVKKHKIHVTPNDKDANKLFRTIDQNFIRFKNIIVFFASSNGFALLFDHKRHCQHVYNVLQQKRVNTFNFDTQLTLSSLEKRFIVPMIQELKNYTELNFDFRIFILKLFKSLDVEQKHRLAPILIATKIEQCLLDSVLKGVELPVNNEEEKKKRPKAVSRKRSSNGEKKKMNQRPEISGSSLQTTGPKLVKQDALFEKELIEQKPTFYNSLCATSSNVAFRPEESTTDNLEISSPPAPKKPRLSNRNKPSKILPEPITTPFEVLDYTQSGVTKTHLFIFSNEERTHCSEYYWATATNNFKCCQNGCRKPGPFLQKDSDGNDQVYFKYPQCSCELRPFDRERYKNDIHVYQPDYKIVEEEMHGKDGLKKKGLKLYVYASEDKKKAYKFSFDERRNRFLCIRCSSKLFSIRACTLKNANGVEFIAIQNKEHKCVPYDC